MSVDKLRSQLRPKYYRLFSQISRLENGVKFIVDLRSDLNVRQFWRMSGPLKSGFYSSFRWHSKIQITTNWLALSSGHSTITWKTCWVSGFRSAFFTWNESLGTLPHLCFRGQSIVIVQGSADPLVPQTDIPIRSGSPDGQLGWPQAPIGSVSAVLCLFAQLSSQRTTCNTSRGTHAVHIELNPGLSLTLIGAKH